MQSNLKTINLFSGIGGIEKGMSQAGFETLIGNEIDSYAAATYRQNHFSPLVVDDVANFNLDSIQEALIQHGWSDKGEADIKGQILTGGFPCQPFSVAGYRKGFEDSRGNVFWEILRLVDELQPEIVFLENVKNLQRHDNGRTFSTIEAALNGHVASPAGVKLGQGYEVRSAVLNSKDFGVPQNRERIYMVAFKNSDLASRFDFPKGSFDASGREWVPRADVSEKFYYSKTSSIFSRIEKEVIEPGVFYQWRRQYVRANKSDLCPTLTANMGMGGHNVPIIRTNEGIRKLTPAECFDLMGFGEISIPDSLADSRLYKQAGNSVVVPVIRAIAEQLKQALS
jgi:DNA (cytosine-5)-methyltransferase 1